MSCYDKPKYSLGKKDGLNRRQLDTVKYLLKELQIVLDQCCDVTTSPKTAILHHKMYIHIFTTHGVTW